MILEVLKNSQENTCVRVSFLIKLQAWDLQLYSKKVWHSRCFPVKFGKLLRTTFLKEHLRSQACKFIKNETSTGVSLWTTQSNKPNIQLYSSGRSHLTPPPLFWLKLFFWCLMFVNREHFLLELFNYETMASPPLTILPIRIISYKSWIKLKSQKGLGIRLHPDIFSQ